ncbi:hypothetical protein DENSPDRAFT_887250 [Dentipellis sp. KUC8613]|nr:hypothetical protein DENSPDRAFT_887250 [Dentipellis sp. KUC8613]
MSSRRPTFSALFAPLSAVCGLHSAAGALSTSTPPFLHLLRRLAPAPSRTRALSHPRPAFFALMPRPALTASRAPRAPRSRPVLISPIHASSRACQCAPSPSRVPSRVRACTPSCSRAFRAAARLSYALTPFSRVIAPFSPPTGLSRAVAPISPISPLSCALTSSRRLCALAPFSRPSCPLRAASSRCRAIAPVSPVPRPPSWCLPLRAVFVPSLCHLRAVAPASRLRAVAPTRHLRAVMSLCQSRAITPVSPPPSSRRSHPLRALVGALRPPTSPAPSRCCLPSLSPLCPPPHAVPHQLAPPRPSSPRAVAPSHHPTHHLLAPPAVLVPVRLSDAGYALHTLLHALSPAQRPSH